MNIKGLFYIIILAIISFIVGYFIMELVG